MISVIIPFYNPEADAALESMLARAVRSALDQTADIEVIVVDDGSPAKPALEEFADDSRVQCIVREHGCLGAARNTGIEAAKGDVIAFLDADDYYFPGTIEPCLKAMKEADADVLGFSFRNVSDSEESCVQAITPEFSTPVSGEAYMSAHNVFGSSCMYLISKELLDRNGLRFMEGSYVEDEDFTPRLLYFSQRFVRTDFKVYAYVRHSGTITTVMTPERLEERSQATVNVISRLIAFRDSVGGSSGLDRKIAMLSMDHLRRTLRRPDWKKSVREQKQALAGIGMFPLPTGDYGKPYRLYRTFSRCGIGLGILHIIEKAYK